MDRQRIIYRGVAGAIVWAFLGVIALQANAQDQAVTVSPGTRVSVEYTLRLEDKAVVETTVGSEPFTYVHGQQPIIPGLEKALTGMKVGESKQVTIPPEEAYGMIDQEAFLEVEKARLPPDAYHVGAQLQGQDPNGRVVRARVAEMKDNTVVLDFNHPLAGKTLYFDVKVLKIQQDPENK